MRHTLRLVAVAGLAAAMVSAAPAPVPPSRLLDEVKVLTASAMDGRAAGTPGKRQALPNARIMIHQPWGKIGQGQAVDLGIQAREFLRTKRLMEELLARHTGQPVEKVHQDTDRDFYMAPEEAQAYGMIDGICTARFKRVAPPSPNGGKSSAS